MYGKRPLAGKELLRSDLTNDIGEERASPMSAFWISHPTNIIRGNVASGTQGTGFWNSFITGDTANTNGHILNQRRITLDGIQIVPQPVRSITKDFSQNVAHTNIVGMTWDGAPGTESANNPNNPDDKKLVVAHYSPPVTPVFSELSNYKNLYTGIYFRGQTAIFSNSIFADNGWSMFFAYNQIVRNSTAIGRSHNHRAEDDSYLYTDQFHRYVRKQHGIVLYDGPFELSGINFLNFPTSKIEYLIDGTNYDVTPSVFGDIGGHRRYYNMVSDIFISPEPYYRMVNQHAIDVVKSDYRSGWIDQVATSHLKDLDGSLTGIVGATVLPESEFSTRQDCTVKTFAGKPSFNGYKICPANIKMGIMYFQTPIEGNKMPFYVIRSDGKSNIPTSADIASTLSELVNPDKWMMNNKFNVITDYEYTVIFRPEDSTSHYRDMPSMILSYATFAPGEMSPVIKIVGLGKNCHFNGGATRTTSNLAELRSLNETGSFSNDNDFYIKIRSQARSTLIAAGGASQESVGDYYFSCDLAPSGKVMGNIDGLSAQAPQSIQGWACDQTISSSISVHLYAGGDSATGTFVTSVVANLTSEENIKSECGTIAGSYRFSIPVTEQMKQQFGGKKIYIHGISSSGGPNLLINSSGNFSIPGGSTSLPGANPEVIGNIDAITSTSNAITGWACDKGVATSIDVHLYVGGASGAGEMAASVKANLASVAAVRSDCGVNSGNYRFSIPITQDFKQRFGGKKIYIHGISTSAARENKTILKQLETHHLKSNCELLLSAL